MASIIINEVDSTLAFPETGDTNVVYVPGFANQEFFEKKAKEDEDYKKPVGPVLCTTIEQFEETFGTAPYQFKEAQQYGKLFDGNAIPTSGNFIDADGFDLSYLYAKELLSLGLSVLYEAVEAKDIEEFYQKLATECLPRLKNKGEYDVKFITSGAYPSFETNISFNLENEEFYFTEFSGKAGELVVSKDIVFDKSIEVEVDEKGKPILTDKDKNDLIKITVVDSSKSTLKQGEPDEDGNISSYEYSVEYIVKVSVDSGEVRTTINGLRVKVHNSKDGKYVATVRYNSVISGTYDIANELIQTAATRGDAIALIDHTNNESRSLTTSTSVYTSINTLSKLTNGEFGAMFTPWCNFVCSQAGFTYKSTDNKLPGSFAYLSALANSVKTNANWMAVAGVTRGRLNNLSNKQPLCGHSLLTNTIADSYQNRNNVSINPITKINPYGYVVWGNRTLKNNAGQGDLTAGSFLNTRNLVCDVKKKIFTACKKLMFEQNSNVLWINFQAEISPLLDQMKSGYGISGYKLIKEQTKQRGKLMAKVILYPTYAVEAFEVTVVLTDDEITVE